MYFITPFCLTTFQKLQPSGLGHRGHSLIFYKRFSFGNGDYSCHLQIKEHQGSQNYEIIDLEKA